MSTALPEGWSITWSDADATLTIAMARMPLTGGFAVERVRVGPLLLDLSLRRRHATLQVRIRHRQGPPATLCLVLPPPGPGLVEVDGVQLRGIEVRFPFSGEHEVVGYY